MATLLLVTGCKSFHSSQDPVVRDQEIARDVLWRLRQDPRLDEVLVACRARVVTLSGRVTTSEAARRAEELADVRDVARVVNRIEVRGK